MLGDFCMKQRKKIVKELEELLLELDVGRDFFRLFVFDSKTQIDHAEGHIFKVDKNKEIVEEQIHCNMSGPITRRRNNGVNELRRLPRKYEFFKEKFRELWCENSQVN